jgi:hypothetical protein
MIKVSFRTASVIVLCLTVITSASAKGLRSKRTPPIPRKDAKAAAGDKELIKLEIAGPMDSRATPAYEKAFAAAGLKATFEESKKGKKPARMRTAVDATTDLAPWAKAVQGAIRVKPNQTAPGLDLLIYAPLTKANQTQVLAQLEKVKGVDSKNSIMDVKKGTVRVRISGSDHVNAQQIAKAVEDAGVTGHFVKTEKKTKKTKT